MSIVFAHNVYNRFDCLVDTIRVEKEFFPKSTSFVAYNNDSPKNTIQKAGLNNVNLHAFDGLTHKIGCANGCIKSIQEALWSFPDVIVFSHDDVRINPQLFSVVAHNISQILSGEADVIVRKPSNIYSKEYYMMEAFYLSRKAAELCFGKLKLFEKETDLPQDNRGSISPEVFLYQALNKEELKIVEKEYFHTIDNYNVTLGSILGFYHEMIGERGWVRAK